VSKNKPWWKRLDEELEGENPYPKRKEPEPYPFPNDYRMPKDRYPDGKL
jgi:hypothetical protein